MVIRYSDSSGGGIPFGDNAGRPANPGIGKLYSNGETARLELYTATGWQNIVQETPGVASASGHYYQSDNQGVFTINGTNFVNGAIAYAVGTNGIEYQATTTTYNSLVQLTATFANLSASYEPYDIKIVNPSNLFGLLPDAFYINESPVWNTTAGSLGTYDLVPVSIQLGSSDAESNQITYSVVSGALPNGLTISSSGLISGSLSAEPGTYTFVVSASDGFNAGVNRSFSISSTGIVTSEVLVVAGGGGSGGNCADAWYAGSGGAGGYRTSSSLTFIKSIQYAITVGLGGAGGTGGTTNSSTRGLNGQNSSIVHSSGTFSATGGGGGGAAQANGSSNAGQNGGSGGGGGSTQVNANAGGIGNINSYSPVEGYNGASGMNGGSGYAGSGGGASGAGTTMSSTNSTVSGGSGISNSITGSAVTYAAGGNIYMNTNNPPAQIANTGNGGNSGSLNAASSPSNGLSGASGIVVIKVPVQAASTTGSPTYSTSGNYHIYRYTQSGTITF